MTIQDQSNVIEGELVLTPPAPVAPLPAGSAARMVKIDAGLTEKLKAKADEFVDGLATADPHSAAFDRKLDSIRTLGLEEIRAAASASNRMLERPLQAMEASGDPLGSKVSTSLVDLRRTVEDLDPSRQGLLDSAQRKVLGLLPFGTRLRSYFGRYRSGQKHLNAVIEALSRGQDELRKDNAAIEQEKTNLWKTMERLRQYAYLAQEVDAGIETRLALPEVSAEEALVLRQDVQFQVRQKVQDLLTQLAVSVQGYLAMDVVRKNNLELIKGVDRATTTTVSALRTAILVAQAMANQKLVLNQISALNTTTGNLIESTSAMLRSQTTEVYSQAASSAVSLEKLQAAFANVYSAIDSIDAYKLQALESMRQTVDVLSVEVDKAQGYLDRTQPAGSSELAISS